MGKGKSYASAVILVAVIVLAIIMAEFKAAPPSLNNQAKENLIANGDFSEGLQHWTQAGWSSDYSVENGILRLGCHARLAQNLTAKAGCYKFTVKYKIVPRAPEYGGIWWINFIVYAGANTFDFHDREAIQRFLYPYYMYLAKNEQEGEWRTVELLFCSSANLTSVLLECGDGEALYVDYVYLGLAP